MNNDSNDSKWLMIDENRMNGYNNNRVIVYRVQDPVSSLSSFTLFEL